MKVAMIHLQIMGGAWALLNTRRGKPLITLIRLCRYQCGCLAAGQISGKTEVRIRLEVFQSAAPLARLAGSTARST